MSHPDELPDLFIDRSLGRLQVPAGLSTAGLRLVTLTEYYGVPADEEVEDTTWLDTLIHGRVRAFCVPEREHATVTAGTDRGETFIEPLPQSTTIEQWRPTDSLFPPGPYCLGYRTASDDRADPWNVPTTGPTGVSRRGPRQ